ncbi:hypothetical protein DESC_180063 [Desulfosarcina cetonica]|nr:hypothetical protein DESC_180063 [Desulfosarcina cetonica]
MKRISTEGYRSGTNEMVYYADPVQAARQRNETGKVSRWCRTHLVRHAKQMLTTERRSSCFVKSVLQ